MQRQAVPLLFSEAAYVATGVEKNIAKQSTAVVVAKRDGKVISLDANTIMILPNNTNNNDNIDVYKLRTFEKTNQCTLVNQRPIVSIGDNVKEGQIIADGSSTDHGEVAIGKNILLAFMPWRGYNYEDSVVISKRLVSEDKFTSIHIEEYEVAVRDTRLGAEEITRDISNVSEEELKYLDETGIIHIGVNVKGGDILVGKITPRSESYVTSEEKLLKAIFGDKVADKKDSSLRMPSGTFGTVVDVKILTRRGDIKDERAKMIEREEINKRTN
jgi:DNA-directed RNA polymerase subunit beta